MKAKNKKACFGGFCGVAKIGPTEKQVEEAKRVLRSEYYTAIRSRAEEIAKEVKKGEISDSEKLSERLDSTVDGDHWVIYTRAAQQVLFVSDNDDAAFEEGLGPSDCSEGIDWSALAYHAMRADLVQMLEAFGVDLNDPAESKIDLSR